MTTKMTGSQDGNIASVVKQKDPQQTILTLGGTGPNGSSQVLHLLNLGWDYVHQLNRINVLSASSFAYFIFIALGLGKLKKENYRLYDKGVREIHDASFFKALTHFARWGLPKKPLYDNQLIKETIRYLWDDDFINMPISAFNENLQFWVYCSASDKNICISSRNFPDMTMWEVVSACVSIPYIHGEFVYGEHSFRDAIFSPSFKNLRRELIKPPLEHVYLNYKKESTIGKVCYLKNTQSKYPDIELLADYAMLAFNFSNMRVNKTHQAVLEAID